ncbi:MAG: hypothetical protein ABGW69_02110, partial [Nanoarchaeota archaeon]
KIYNNDCCEFNFIPAKKAPFCYRPFALHFHYDLKELKSLDNNLPEKLTLFFNLAENKHILEKWYGRKHYHFIKSLEFLNPEDAYNSLLDNLSSVIGTGLHNKITLLKIKYSSKNQAKTFNYTFEFRGLISPLYYTTNPDNVIEIVNDNDKQLDKLISEISSVKNPNLLLINNNRVLEKLVKDFINYRRKIEEKYNV